MISILTIFKYLVLPSSNSLIAFVMFAEKGQSLKDEIPLQLLSHLTTPTAHCQQCHRPIFVYGFPIVFRAQVQGSDLPLLGLCCTAACVHLCSRVVHLPLMFPRLEDLALAIVLAWLFFLKNRISFPDNCAIILNQSYRMLVKDLTSFSQYFV